MTLQRSNDTTENMTVPIAANIEGQTAILAQSPNIEWPKLPTVLPSSIQPIRPSEAATKENDWNIVENKKARTTWRQKANILTGTAKGDAGGDILSADVNLVVYGLAKNVTSLQLSRFMESKGLNILNCDLLTKFDGARSNSFKITIRSCEYDKITNADLWPLGVGVRAFKHFNKRNQDQNRTRNANPRSAVNADKVRYQKGVCLIFIQGILKVKVYLSVALNTLIIHMYKKWLLIRISKVKMYACFRIIQEDSALISNNYVKL